MNNLENEIDISVIVPVYKIAEDFLKRCLQSLKAQTLESCEFIIVDDGSPDNCGNICEETTRGDRRFKVIHTTNQGVSNARNVGFNNSHGKYIMYVDGDDYIFPNTCELCLKAMKKSNADMLMFQYTTSNETSVKIKNEEVKILTDIEIKKLKQSVVSGIEYFDGFFAGPPWGKVLKKEIIQKYKIQYVYGLKKSQDRVFVFDYLAHVETVALFNYIGYCYVNNPGSTTRKYNPQINDILRKAEKEFYTRICKLPDKTDYQQAFNQMCLNFAFTILQLNILNRNNEDNIFQKRDYVKKLACEKIYSNALKTTKIENMGKRKTIVLTLLKHKMYLATTIIGSRLLN